MLLLTKEQLMQAEAQGWTRVVTSDTDQAEEEEEGDESVAMGDAFCLRIHCDGPEMTFKSTTRAFSVLVFAWTPEGECAHKDIREQTSTCVFVCPILQSGYCLKKPVTPMAIRTTTSLPRPKAR